MISGWFFSNVFTRNYSIYPLSLQPKHLLTNRHLISVARFSISKKSSKVKYGRMIASKHLELILFGFNCFGFKFLAFSLSMSTTSTRIFLCFLWIFLQPSFFSAFRSLLSNDASEPNHLHSNQISKCLYW